MTSADRQTPRGARGLDSAGSRSVLRTLVRTVGLLATAALGAVVCGYALGELLSDRLALSQWLSWIPTEAALTAAVATLIASGLTRWLLYRIDPSAAEPRWWRLAIALAAAATVALGSVLLTVEHRPFRRAATPVDGAIGVLHWNPRWPNRTRAVPVAETLESILADHPSEIVILTDPGLLLFDGRAQELALGGRTVARSGVFAVLTTLPIRELRALARYDGIDVTILRIGVPDPGGAPAAGDGSAADADELVFWLVNLPSDPRLPRMAMARELRAMLDDLGAPPPDLLLGDLNNVRRSAALRTIAPGMRNAFSIAGRGFGSTFAEPWPLLDIDHVLVADSIEAIEYRTIETGASEHRAQHAVVRRRP